jgi:hypothetical protein
MVDDDEWAWIEREARRETEHLLIGTSLPFLLPRGIDALERWDERACAGAWGRLGARLAEKARQGLDLEHWAAFGSSWQKLMRLAEEVAERATVVVLSGDVHYSYLAQVEGRRIYQATCSPLRNPLRRAMRLLGRISVSPVADALGAGLRRLAAVPDPRPPWRLLRGPWFDNVIATLELEGPHVRLKMEKTVPERGEEPALELVYEHVLAP